MKGNKNVMKTVQSFFCVELQYLESSSGGHLRNRAGHVKQKTRLKILCLFCECYGEKKFIQKFFTQIVRLSFVDLRWAQLYVSLVLRRVFCLTCPALFLSLRRGLQTLQFILIKNSSNFRKKSPFESILEKNPPSSLF